MCLYVKANAVAHVAKKDIVVYKIVRRRKVENSYYNYFTGIKRFIYTLGKKTKSVELKPYMTIILPNCYRIEEGFHSYSDKPNAFDMVSSSAAIKCIIPKGATYYKGHPKYSKGELVSSCIIPIEEVKLNN